MNWLVIPIAELKQFDKDWESRRSNVAGTEAILHEEIYNELDISMVFSIIEEDMIQKSYPVKDKLEIEALLKTNEWNDTNSII